MVTPRYQGLAPMTFTPAVREASQGSCAGENWVLGASSMAQRASLCHVSQAARIGTRVLDSQMGPSGGSLPQTPTAGLLSAMPSLQGDGQWRLLWPLLVTAQQRIMLLLWTWLLLAVSRAQRSRAGLLPNAERLLSSSQTGVFASPSYHFIPSH